MEITRPHNTFVSIHPGRKRIGTESDWKSPSLLRKGRKSGSGCGVRCWGAGKMFHVWNINYFNIE